MGPLGSGNSTLLDALAGRLRSNIQQSGKILINGKTQTLAYGTSGYVTQDDAMLSNLTAVETLYYLAQLQFPNSMSIAEKKRQADIILREMGLQDAINTREVGSRLQEVNVLGGVILLVWGNIQKALSKQVRQIHKRLRIVRVETTSDNKHIVGLLVPNAAVKTVLQGLTWVIELDD